MLRLLADEVQLRLEGFIVDSATRGDEALAIAEATPPAAVLLDVVDVPGSTSARGVSRRLRTPAGLAEVPMMS